VRGTRGFVRRHGRFRSRYLNNIVEQDHRAIKGRCACMLGFKSMQTAAITLSGIELAHRIRKGQFSIGDGSPRELSLKQLWKGRFQMLRQLTAS
jgi:transposase-like protein